MCGIAGTIVRAGALTQDANPRRRALELLHHRGPDGHGQCERGQVWFGHTRLSILDLSDAGQQPMLSNDGGARYAITYNGEIYNYRDLATELRLENLHSACDTEVVLRAFESIGPDLFRKLNGMFAFAIHDQETRQVWLVRDRLGIKPLYYYLDNQRLVFASELKALFTLLGSTPAANVPGMHEWLFYGNSLGGRTLFQGIQQLLPGYSLQINLDTFTPVTTAYWSLQEQARQANQTSQSTKTLIDTTRERLEAAVKRQLVSDVPIGVFLSGGIDSSAITAFASRHYAGRLLTFSAGFDDPRYPDERPKARRIAQHFNTDHHELFIEGRDIAQVVEVLIDHHGTPFFDAANIPLYLMARQVSGQIKVALQGDGGDEVFGGYRRYATLRMRRVLHVFSGVGRLASLVMPTSPFRQRIQRYCNIYGRADPAELMGLLLTTEGLDDAALEAFEPCIRSKILSADPLARYRAMQSQFTDLDIGQQMSMVDLSIELPDVFLEKVDRSTMAHGLEIRVPFLDHELIDFIARIPGQRKMPFGRKKWLLKKALRGIVPDFVLDGPKTGFNVPIKHWLMGPLRSHFRQHLADFDRANPGIIRTSALETWFEMTEQGKADLSPRLWKMYNLLIWANRFKVQFDL